MSHSLKEASMSSKINIFGIIKGHFDTLADSEGTISIIDILTFIALPLILAFASLYSSFNLKPELSSLLVNFGSILTALLLSVLVLVYQQESKLDQNQERAAFIQTKKTLLRQIYFNISFSVIGALALVIFCFLHSMLYQIELNFTLKDYEFNFRLDTFFLTPIIIFVCSNLILNILMIVKRMHTLLVAEDKGF